MWPNLRSALDARTAFCSHLEDDRESGHLNGKLREVFPEALP
jgi:hypothetical protein